MATHRRCLCFPEVLCGYDVDDLFAYTAAKSVRIRDMRLGLLHYAFTLAIFVYIVVYQLVYNWGYLKFSDPKIAVRLSVQQPTIDHCNPNKAGCMDSLIPLSQLRYCCQANNKSCTPNQDGSCNCDFRPEFKNYNCTYMDGADVSSQRESSMFVASFTHAYTQKLNRTCFSGFPSGADSCSKMWLPAGETSTFTANVEDYTLLIDHSVSMIFGDQGKNSPDDSSYTARQMQGKLAVTGVGPTQNRLCASYPAATALGTGLNGFLFDTGAPAESAPCLLPPGQAQDNPGPDVFKLSTLLEAMDVSLDNRSYEGSTHSRRYEGLVVKIAVQYHNVKLWHLGTVNMPYYFYNVSVINGSTYKEVEVIKNDYPFSRIKQDRHGILFEVNGAGQLAHFSGTQLLIQLTTSLTLFAMATLAVSTLAQYCLKYRQYYSHALYDTTVDFSDLMRVDRMNDAVIEQELSARNLVWRHLNREARVTRLLEAGFMPRSGMSTPSVLSGAGGPGVPLQR